MTQVAVKVEGLNEIIKRLAGDPIYARPWRRALGRISSNVKRLIRARAPVKSGRTARGVFYRMPRQVVPLYSVISDRAKRKGVRYPFVINAGHRKSRSGRDVQLHFRGSGQSTRGWFERAGQGIQGYVNQALQTAVDQIQRRWAGQSDD